MSRMHFALFNPRFRWTLFLSFAAVCFTPLISTAPAQQSPEIEFSLFELPASRQTLTKLNSPAVATFEKRPLGECLQSISDFYDIAIWVDRRVDRSRLVSNVGMATKESPEANTTLGRIRGLAKLGNADAGLIENVVYVGPAEQLSAVQFTAVRLHNQIMLARKKAPNSNRAEAKPLTWEELATPSDLLNSIRQNWSIEIDAELPHDLMHAGELPASTLATQLTLLLAGFGQQADCSSATRFSVSPLTNETVWKSDYAAKVIQTNQYSAAKREFPAASLQTRNGTSTVMGPTGFHLKLLAVRAAPVRNIEPKFTLDDVRGPVEQIVGGLAKRLGLQVSWSDAVPLAKRQAVITFGVAKAKTPDEIIAQLAKDCGLSIQRNGETILVSPSEQ